MKHILNNLTEEEKNNIRKQHKGGMTIMTENFNKLINSKLGDLKPLVEQKIPLLTILTNPSNIFFGGNNDKLIYLSQGNTTYTYIIAGEVKVPLIGGKMFNVSFSVKLRNITRDKDGALKAEAYVDNWAARNAIQAIIIAKKKKEILTEDEWIKVYVPVDKVNKAINDLRNNKGLESTIDAGDGINISLKLFS